MLKNEIHIDGKIATEPIQTGRGPTKFRLAHGGGGKKKNGEPWPTQFFSVSVWDKALVEGMKKGIPVDIFGKLRDSTYTTKDGTVKYGVEIVAEEIRLEQVEPQPAPLIPNQITGTGGVAAARAILRPAAKPTPQPKNIHGLEVSDADIPF